MSTRSRFLALIASLVGVAASAYLVAQPTGRQFDELAMVVVGETPRDQETARRLASEIGGRLRTEERVRVRGDLMSYADETSANKDVARLSKELKVQGVAIVGFRHTGSGDGGVATVSVRMEERLLHASKPVAPFDGYATVVLVAEKVADTAKAGLAWIVKQASNAITAAASRGQLVHVVLEIKTTPPGVNYQVGTTRIETTDASTGIALWSATQRPGQLPVVFTKLQHEQITRVIKVPSTDPTVRVPLAITLRPRIQ